MANEAVRYRLLLIAAGIFFVVAAIVGVGVIPAVKTDTYPQATPDSAISAFIVSGILHVVLGVLVLALILRRGKQAGKVQLGAVGLLGLLLGIPLLDAASAYAYHGPGMWVATVALFACAGGDLVAGILAFTAAFLHGRDLAKAVTAK